MFRTTKLRTGMAVSFAAVGLSVTSAAIVGSAQAKPIKVVWQEWAKPVDVATPAETAATAEEPAEAAAA